MARLRKTPEEDELASGPQALAALGFTWDESHQANIIVRASVAQQRNTVLFRYRAAIPEFVWDAATLEGSTATKADVETLTSGGLVEELSDHDLLMISNLVDAHRALDEMVRSGTFQLSKETSDILHAYVAQGDALEAGHFRGQGTELLTFPVSLSDGGVYWPLESERGGLNLIDRFAGGLAHIERNVTRSFSRALSYFAFATREQFYFDGNKRTARMMMNGYLMSQGLDAISVPGTRAREWEAGLLDLFKNADATALFSVLTDAQPEIRYVRSGRTEQPNWGDGRSWEEVGNRAAGDNPTISR